MALLGRCQVCLSEMQCAGTTDRVASKRRSLHTHALHLGYVIV